MKPLLSPLRFEYQAMISELELLRTIAAEFLEPKVSSTAIKMLSDQLQQCHATPTTETLTWKTDSWSRIRTALNHGKHQSGARGGRILYGEIAFNWEIQNFADKPKKKSRKYTHFQLCGLASTRVYVYQQRPENASEPVGRKDDELVGRKDDELVGRWNFDIGSLDAPGCHFHVQLPEMTEPFRYPLDVPRWPSLVVTPTDAVDFLLGELFQEHWHKHRSRTRRENKDWSKLQQTRLLSTLDWMRSQVTQSLKANPACSPWLELKAAKPPADLMLKR